jgi:hypothetical protein
MLFSACPNCCCTRSKSAPMWNVAFYYTENTTFSIWTGAGMDSMRAMRSPVGVVAEMDVGGLCGVGCTACGGGLASWVSSFGAGSANITSSSSMSVSLGRSGKEYCVFLVSTGMFLHKRTNVLLRYENGKCRQMAYKLVEMLGTIMYLNCRFRLQKDVFTRQSSCI